MRVIVAAADALLRGDLVSGLGTAGFHIDEIAASAADLERRLDRLDAGRPESTLVVTGAVWQAAEAFARIALERGVPVALWPPRATAVRRADLAAVEPRLAEPRGTDFEAAAPRSTSHLDPAAPGDGSTRRLTDRGHEVLALVAAGISNKGIARRLGLSPNTVKFHVTALLAKLGASTRAEAVAAAARRGELSL